MVPVTIQNITVPDQGDKVIVTITSILQDELVNDIGGGSGNTSPDAAGIGTDIAQLRAERSANGHGRMYHINFLACAGQVIVSVPHDQAHKAVASRPLYDSTALTTSAATTPSR